MRHDIISLDLETTGLNQSTDEIIEVGAVRWRDGAIVAQFNTLIRPTIEVPKTILHLTGIQLSELAKAPQWSEVRDTLRAFIGDAIFLAHKADADLAFLEAMGMPLTNPILDTLELSTLLLPYEENYRLGTLCKSLGVDLKNAHRALDDAIATAELYQRLYEYAKTLPKQLIGAILQFSAPTTWPMTHFFRELYADAPLPSLADIRELVYARMSSAEVLPTQPEPSTPAEGISGGLPAIVQAALLGNKQQLLQVHPCHPLAEVLQALPPEKHVLLITSNTAAWERRAGVRASTYTSTSELICLDRLFWLMERRPRSLDELRVLLKLIVVIDRDGLKRGLPNLRGAEYDILPYLQASFQACTPSECSSSCRAACPLAQPRQTTGLQIVHPRTLLLDVQQQPLPAQTHLLLLDVDDLDETLTTALTSRISEATWSRMLLDLRDESSGLLSNLLTSAQPHISEKRHRTLATFLQEQLYVALDGVAKYLTSIYAQLRQLPALEAAFNATNRAQFPSRLVVDTQRLAEFWAIAEESIQSLLDALPAELPSPARLHFNAVRATAKQLNRTVRTILEAMTSHKTALVSWLNPGEHPEQLAIMQAPVHIAPTLKQKWWSQAQSVTWLTTLAYNDTTQAAFVNKFGLDDFNISMVPIPETLPEILVYLVNDTPEPSRPNFQPILERELVQTALTLGGYTVGLFTNYTHFRDTVAAIETNLTDHGLALYDQMGNIPLVDSGLPSLQQGLFVGTRQTWEAATWPIAEIRALLLTRLPFHSPFEYVKVARADQSQDGFNEVTLAEVMFMMKRAYDKLCRGAHHKAVWVILDSRAANKGYGAQLFEDLPNISLRRSAVARLHEALQSWLPNS